MADYNPTYKCWMDADDKHIWQQHRCNDLVSTSMLPQGQAKAWWRAGVKVCPSIDCTRCGLHEWDIPIGPAPDGFFS